MSNIYFTSDTHYHHKNICRGTSQWDRFGEGSSHQSTRDFATLEEMNQAIVDGINNKVGADDILYHLGDWSFGGLEQIWNFRKQINCKNIHLIFGNHDHHIENNKNIEIHNTLDEHTLYNSYNSRSAAFYAVKDKNILAAVRGLFASTQYVKTIKAGSTSIFMSHFAHRVWDKSHHGRIHLYGHSHASLEHEEWGKSLDVGVDNYYRLYGKYEPFSLAQIWEIMAKRQAKIIDHHNKTTN
jgi:calcineurin-like phosphoesterase family protein